MLNVAFDPAETKVKRLLVSDWNMSKVIYTPVLTRRWVIDFHSGLEKAAACREVTDSYSKRGFGMDGWMDGGKWKRGVWTQCEPLNKIKKEKER